MNKTITFNRIPMIIKSALIVLLALLLLCAFPFRTMAANEVEYDEPMEGYIDEPYDGDSMWLRETPGGTAIEQLSAGTLVSVTGHGYDKYNYKWYHITFDGKSGYVNYKYVVLLFVAGMMIHWLPARFKRRYRLWFAAMPLPLIILAAAAAVLLAYQFITADMQPFIYFQF